MGGLYETRKTGSDPQQRRGNVNRRMCRLAFLLVPQQPPRSPRFARLARRPALDPQEDNHIGVHHKQRKRYLKYGQAASVWDPQEANHTGITTNNKNDI